MSGCWASGGEGGHGNLEARLRVNGFGMGGGGFFGLGQMPRDRKAQPSVDGMRRVAMVRFLDKAKQEQP